jgi:signal transduction histidine kinase
MIRTDNPDKSWKFLLDFVQEDSSMLTLINDALCIRSKRKVCKDTLLNDIRSLLQNKDFSTYHDFLSYVVPDKRLDADASVDDLENAIINYIWLNVLANSAANQYFSKGLKENSISGDYKPYLIMYALGITKTWFLYGGKSAFKFVDDDDALQHLKRELKRGYRSWNSNFHFYKSPKNLLSIFLWTRQLSAEQLYPLTVLLITLRKEWQFSQNSNYLRLKADSLIKNNYHTFDVYISLIYGIYNNFEGNDVEIKNFYEPWIDPIEIHPLVAKNIIANEAYIILFTFDPIEINDKRNNSQLKYKNTEESLDNERFDGKRLLVDYHFPYTKVRENDIFIPNESLIDRIYLSLVKGVDYKKFYRKPYKGEKFDLIQIDPITNSTGEYDDGRVIGYQIFLLPTGKFLTVQPEKEIEINKRLKQEFSDFRHDLKPLIENSCAGMLVLNSIISNTLETSDEVDELYRIADDFLEGIGTQQFKERFASFRQILKSMDSSSKLSKIVISEFMNGVGVLRDVVEDLDIDNIRNSDVEQIHSCITNIKQASLKSYNGILSRCSKIANSVNYSYDVLNSYIKTAGTTSQEVDNDVIRLNDFLKEYISNSLAIDKSIRLTLDCLQISDDCTVKYNKARLIVMLNSIVDNARKHGFKDFNLCESPEIHFNVVDSGDYILLNICNNGKPIEITTEDYKASGVFKGITGHTGIGGFQISKYAEQQGGFVEIPIVKQWNTEINLYIKK